MKHFILAMMAALPMLLSCKSGDSSHNSTDMNSNTPSPATEAPDSADAIVKMQTSMGDVTLRLFGDTPRHRDNFLRLAREGFYDGVLFHRVIADFMVQAGDPDSRYAPAGQMLGSGDPGYTLPAEIRWPRHYHRRGALAAARQGDQVNPERRSSGSQFYIVTGTTFSEPQLSRFGIPFTPEQIADYTSVGGTPHLDGQYTVFGEVVDGMDVVDAIQHVATGRYDRPVDDVKILKMTVVE